jgi:cysteine desulfurase NifS/selenium donor protein
MDKIYLDYNATTPIDKEVAAEMQPYLDIYFGNPSSNHEFGMKAKMAVEKTRVQMAKLLNCKPEEIVFTSGGSESNNYAIKGIANARRSQGNHIITSSVEHPAVIEVCKYLETKGFKVTYLEVDENGLVSPEDLEKAISNETILVSIMHANNEVGVIQPIKKLAEIAHNHNIVFHTDAAQSVGKIPTDISDMGVDLLSVAGHKLYAPKGIGVLYIKTGIKLEKLIHGANHENNLRAGTENVLEIVGLGKAAEIAFRDMDKNIAHYSKMRDKLEELLKAGIDDIKINSADVPRLPNTSSVSIPNVEANTLLDEIQEVAASAGAACHAEDIDISSVLEAMKIPIQYAMGTIRFSTGRSNTIAEMEQAAEIFIEKVNNIRGTDEVGTQIVNTGEIKLTHYSHGMGCACKIRPQDLEKILQQLPVSTDKNVLIGTDSSDDATVYKINDEQAIVQTLDFFTPIVDDPYQFGAIAAANAMSDVYAMGAKPLFALNIVGFPNNRLPMSVLHDILRGAQDKATEAGISVLGGHSIEDPEPKYGMVVTGIINPEKVLSNNGAKANDILLLTKSIGTGIISTATKKGLVSEKIIEEHIQIMSTLNKYAAETLENYHVNACTDVTGFGLMGHAREMVLNTKVGLHIDYDKVPFIEGAKELAVAGIIPGGTINNSEYVKNEVIYDEALTRADRMLLCDAQTSGGLLIAITEAEAGDLLRDLIVNGVNAKKIGKFTSENAGKIHVS